MTEPRKYRLLIPTPDLSREPLPTAPRKPPEPLTDDSPMPWGKHKGKPMGKIPGEYLLWLWDNGKHEDKTDPVHLYIKGCWNALLKEFPDYIAENPPPREY